VGLGVYHKKALGRYGRCQVLFRSDVAIKIRLLAEVEQFVLDLYGALRFCIMAKVFCIKEINHGRKNMRKLLIIIALMLGVAFVGALEITMDTAFDTRDLNSKDYALLIQPGQPMLHYYKLNVLLPYGEEYSGASISWGRDKEAAKGISIDFAREQMPVSRSDMPGRTTTADAKVYGNDAFFPYRDFEYLGTQYYRGYAVAMFNLFPIRYNPVKKEVRAYESFTFDLQSVPDPELAERQSRHLNLQPGTRRVLSSLVKNPQTISSYQSAGRIRSSSRNLDPAQAKNMIIITNEARMPWFDEYAAWRESHGISTGIFSTEYIYANYAGVDNAEKVRNFILDAYLLWLDTPNPLEYVILGGDDEIVPERGVFGRVGSTVDNRMPSDLYYSNLDGNWNANGNEIYGEMQDNADMIPEIRIGRFPAETLYEFNNIFHKIRYYVDNDTFSNNVAVFYGENLNNNPLTWGGDYKDDVAQYLPQGYSYSTQYQRDGTYSAVSVMNSINAGVNVMNHMGHANEVSLMGLGGSAANQLHNTEYGFLFSQGCYPAAFDQRTSGDGESVAENLITASGGLFSFVGNTRYGWYMPGGIDGASQFYDRQFFIGLYQEDQSELGAALDYCRLENLNAALSSDVMRWCYMETILFGDPSVEVKLANPALPMLSLESYEFDDSNGDGDGTINPGESIILRPVVSNAEGWGTAYQVSIRVVDVPAGVETDGTCILLDQLLPGESSPQDIAFGFTMPVDLNFGNFNIRLAVESFDPETNLSTGIKYYDAGFEVTLLDGRFPWETANAGKSAPIVGDFDGDGSKDIMYLDVFGIAHLISSDGQEYANFQTEEELSIFRSSAMAQIDNLEGEDLAISSRTGNIVAMNLEGEQIFDYSSATAFLFSPVIADINDDSQNEVIATGLDGKLYVIQSDGSDAPGFPLQLDSTVQSELAVGRFYADGPMQIVLGTRNGNALAIGAGGIINADFGQELGSVITGSPVILNNARYAIATNSDIYLIGEAGIEFQQAIDAPIAGGLICADINRDGSLDIIGITNSGVLYVMAQTGEHLPGFPVETGTIFSCPPLVADLDSDAQYEILVHTNINSIYAYNHDGSPMAGFPFGTTYNGSTPGTLSDFDGDGYFKLIAGFSNGILMSNLRREASALAPWPTYRGSLSRQASFAATGYVANEDTAQSPARLQLLQNYPNPFNPETTIAFELPAAQQVSLDIFNIKGQKVRNLKRGPMDGGRHSLVWNSTDDGGTILPSGLYFYRLHTNTQTITRKMLLLK
jgi:hypothetical protein